MNINMTLIAQAIAFAIFIWFTAHFIWPYMLRAIEERQKKIAEGLAAGERGRQELLEAQSAPRPSSPAPAAAPRRSSARPKDARRR